MNSTKDIKTIKPLT